CPDGSASTRNSTPSSRGSSWGPPWARSVRRTSPSSADRDRRRGSPLDAAEDLVAAAEFGHPALRDPVLLLAPPRLLGQRVGLDLGEQQLDAVPLRADGLDGGVQRDEFAGAGCGPERSEERRVGTTE